MSCNDIMKYFCYMVCIFVGCYIFVIDIDNLVMSRSYISNLLRDQRQFLEKTDCDRSFHEQSTIIDDECAYFEKSEPLIDSIANVAMRLMIIFKCNHD